MSVIRPKALKAGDTVAAVSLSWGGASVFPHRYEAGKRQLEQAFGLKVVEAPNALRSAAELAAEPALRVADLIWAFENPDIKAVFSIIGGDDSVRILPYVDPALFRDNPKIFMGFSDSTVTHMQCFAAGLRSVYGPSLMAGFAENGGLFDYMKASVQRTLFSTDPIGELKPNTDGWTDVFLDWADPENQNKKRPLVPSLGNSFLQGSRKVQGPLIGGCIEVLEMLKGTPVWPSPEQWDGAVLFLETSEEAPSPSFVIRCLRNYAASGLLQRLSGLLLGRPANIPPNRHSEYDEAIHRVLNVECGLSDMPIVTQMDFGHTDPMMCLPYGAMTTIDPDARTIVISDSAVV